MCLRREGWSAFPTWDTSSEGTWRAGAGQAVQPHVAETGSTADCEEWNQPAAMATSLGYSRRRLTRPDEAGYVLHSGVNEGLTSCLTSGALLLEQACGASGDGQSGDGFACGGELLTCLVLEVGAVVGVGEGGFEAVELGLLVGGSGQAGLLGVVPPGPASARRIGLRVWGSAATSSRACRACWAGQPRTLVAKSMAVARQGADQRTEGCPRSRRRPWTVAARAARSGVRQPSSRPSTVRLVRLVPVSRSSSTRPVVGPVAAGGAGAGVVGGGGVLVGTSGLGRRAAATLAAPLPAGDGRTGAATRQAAGVPGLQVHGGGGRSAAAIPVCRAAGSGVGVVGAQVVAVGQVAPVLGAPLDGDDAGRGELF